MKFRTDFVTNSSSSSFLTVIMEYKNGFRQKAEFELDEANMPSDFLVPDEIHSGEDLLAQLEGIWTDLRENDYPEKRRIRSVKDVGELSRLEIRCKLEFDDEPYSHVDKCVLIGDPDAAEPTKAEIEKTFRYATSTVNTIYPEADYGGYEDSLRKITSYLGTEPDVVIPGHILKGNVADIGPKAFAGLDHITSVTVPEGVVRICAGAFFNCPNLKTVHLPLSLLEIGAKAFANCPLLEMPNIPAGAKVAEDAFAAMSPNESVFVTELEENKKKFKLRVNKKVIVITGRKGRDRALQFPETIDDLPVMVDCDAFVKDQYVEKLVWPINGFGNRGFADCPKLKEVEIPESITAFTGYELENTPFMRDFPGLIIINHVLMGYNGDEPEVVLPPEVKEIANGFLERAPNLRVLEIPTTVERLNYGAFRCIRKKYAHTPIEIRIPGDHLSMKELHIMAEGQIAKLYGPVGGKVEKYARAQCVRFEAI